MTRAELEHAIRAACDVSGDDEVYVFGSQAILGQYPKAPESLRQSAEADIAASVTGECDVAIIRVDLRRRVVAICAESATCSAAQSDWHRVLAAAISSTVVAG